MKCPYCGSDAKLVTGDAIYAGRTDLADLNFWRCEPCDAHVGCHKKGAHVLTATGYKVSDGTMPFGRLANALLRHWKQMAHREFDPLWKAPGMSRRRAYLWLSQQMGIPFEQCHIGNFDVEQCEQVVMLSLERSQQTN